ncbi:ArdC-like ssDNA-binding domain-containing protein [Faecalispora sporosphaeroides]|uniref:ArdC-like ssDNA-binding domain-containing protein n=1 Tax=Faecalispora sporosphaeroides TaxID=1549 RepID=UPI00036E246A|nr:ArdC-like ssDNA-binding domain-containing protein [Faecalispora sporosphaeroides]
MASDEKYKEITDKLLDGVTEVFHGDRFKQYLQTMSKFHSYSFRNSLLIHLQMPEAKRVAGFESWKKLNRYVKRGQKGIAIFAPYLIKKKIQLESENPAKEGEETEQSVVKFKIAYVWDVSQTEGDPLPSFCNELTGKIDRFDQIFSMLKDISPYNICFEQIPGNTKGYCNSENKKIAIKISMSDEQTIKTLIHEIAHSLLHEDSKKSREQEEVEAESVAFIISDFLGVDTSSYSFDYVAIWSSKMEASELQDILANIQQQASAIVSQLSEKFEALAQEKEKVEPITECGLDEKLHQAEQKIARSNQQQEVMKYGKNLFQ